MKDSSATSPVVRKAQKKERWSGGGLDVDFGDAAGVGGKTNS